MPVTERGSRTHARAAWAVFAALATVVTTATLVAGPAIDRERGPA